MRRLLLVAVALTLAGCKHTAVNNTALRPIGPETANGSVYSATTGYGGNVWYYHKTTK